MSPIGLTALLLALSGCGAIGNPLDLLGAKIPAPDEFQVIASKPLVMPATNTLPEPRPGASSPLAPNPNLDAQRALLGSSSTVVSASAPSTGEQVLLNSANAATASSEIRVQLEQDKIDESANQPYEPPSLFALFGGSSGPKLDETTLLDPLAEANRLQGEGKATPVDPNATAEVAPEPPPAVKKNYPTGRPQSPITVTGTSPTY